MGLYEFLVYGIAIACVGAGAIAINRIIKEC